MIIQIVGAEMYPKQRSLCHTVTPKSAHPYKGNPSMAGQIEFASSWFPQKWVAFHGPCKCPKKSHRIHGTGIFPYIWLIFMVNEGKYTIHGSYGNYNKISKDSRGLCDPQLPVFASRPVLPAPSLLLGIYIWLGVSLNGGTPKTPQNDHF